MEYKNLEEINKTLRKTDIKGKDYVEVNERVKAFWKLCPNGKIITRIYSLENGIITIQAEVYENGLDELPRATGIAQEISGSTFINKTSYVENCETSAVGRALGNAGIGIDTSIASAEEVQNAIVQQEGSKPISSKMVLALTEAIRNKEYTKSFVEGILNKYGCKTLSEITEGKLADIKKELGI